MPRTIACIAAAASVAAALSPPIVAQAHEYRDYCTGRIHDNGVVGALLGGATGAVIGSNVARGGGRTGGALIGAAAGAALGSNIARSTTKDRCRGPRDVGYYYGPPPPPPVYVAPEPVYVAPPPPPPPYGYVIYDGPHDHGWHHGWYKHHHHHHDDDDGDD